MEQVRLLDLRKVPLYFLGILVGTFITDTHVLIKNCRQANLFCVNKTTIET